MDCYGKPQDCDRMTDCKYAASCRYYAETEHLFRRKSDSFELYENSEAFAIEDIPAEPEVEEQDELAAKAEELAQVMYQAQARRRINLVKRMHHRRR